MSFALRRFVIRYSVVLSLRPNFFHLFQARLLHQMAAPRRATRSGAAWQQRAHEEEDLEASATEAVQVVRCAPCALHSSTY
jgi:hypothetical protein